MKILKQIKKNILFGKSKTIQIMAPIDGTIIPIEAVPDTVFADKIVGDGLAINPTNCRLVAPCQGTIGNICTTNHAFSIQTKQGIELFVHFGVDTVELKGEGFQRIGKEGASVQTGDLIIQVDLDFITKKAASIMTPVVISNMELVKYIEKSSGTIKTGEVLLTVHMK